MTRSRDVSAVQNNLGVAIPPAAAGKNAVINGGFDIWQRGTSFTNPTSSATAYCADRWQAFRGGFATGITTARQSSGQTGIEYSIRVQRNSGNAATDGLYLLTNFESTNSIPFAGKTITVSFYAKAGANFSSSGSTLECLVVSGTGTNENYISGSFTGGATVIQQNATLTTSWQRFTYTATVGSTATQLAIRFYYAPTGTASTNDWFEITGVQLELGSSATPFSRNGSSIQGELAACQRYYQRFTTADAYSILGVGGSQSTTQAKIVCPLPVTMRTKPSAIDYATLGIAEGGAAIIALTALALEYHTNQQGALIATVASGLTANRPMYLFTNNSASAYLGFSAEL